MIENELQMSYKGLLSIKCDRPHINPGFVIMAAFLTFHKNETSALNAAILFVVIFRNHPGDDKRDAGVHREAHARRHSGVAETGRGGQPAGLAGRHTGKTGNQIKLH